MFWSINGESEWTWHTQVPLSIASSFFKFIMYFWWLLFCNSGVTLLLLLSNNVILRSGRGLDEFCIKISSGTSFCRKCPSEEIITVKRNKRSQSVPPPVRERQMLQQREHGDGGEMNYDSPGQKKCSWINNPSRDVSPSSMILSPPLTHI